MNDRELLELAAKAAGLLVEFEEGDCNGWYPLGRDEGGDVDHWWNPLTDDGDALRLAGKLRINIYFGHGGEGPIHCGQFGAAGATEWDAGTEQESLRRAIVRAAAEIGKDKP